MNNFSYANNGKKTYVLIDTWWNVNIFPELTCPFPFRVLIDTWWNVNITYGSHRYLVSVVLIDTWWNVNHYVINRERTNTMF